MKMKTALTTAFGLILGLSLLAGCSGGGSAISTCCPTPPPVSPPPHTPTPAATHLYIYSANNGTIANGTINAYALPITTTSIPVASIADASIWNGGSQNAMAFDATHRLFVTQINYVQVFTPPIADGATSAFILTTGGRALHDVKVDSAGDVFVAGTSIVPGTPCGQVPCNLIAGIDVITAPVTSSSTVNFHIRVGSKFPFGFGTLPVGMALDGSGNLWAGTNATMFKYVPPFSGTSVPALQFPIGFDASDLAFDSTGNLYAASPGGVIVYKPPFTTSTVKAFTISTNGDAANFLAFDTKGNLYVTTGGVTAKVLVFSPPFSGTSAPVVTLVLPGSSAMGVAIGS